MARAEELSKAADKYTADKEHYVERCRWIDGAEWADKTMIDKACDWLEEVIINVKFRKEGMTSSYSGIKSLIHHFRKAMED